MFVGAMFQLGASLGTGPVVPNRVRMMSGGRSDAKRPHMLRGWRANAVVSSIGTALTRAANARRMRLPRPFRRRPEPDWLPLPYEQAILIPAPDPPDYSVALTPDGLRFLSMEPRPRVLLSRRRGRRVGAWVDLD